MFYTANQIRDQSRQFSKVVQNRECSPFAYVFPGIISALGAVIGLSFSMNWQSRLWSILGGGAGLATIAYGVEYAADKSCKHQENIFPTIELSRKSQNLSLQTSERICQTLKEVQFALKEFFSSLDSEQAEEFLLALGEHKSLNCEPLLHPIRSVFRLTPRQNEIIEAFALIEKKKTKGLETICKFLTAGERKKEMASFLDLSLEQKELFELFLSSLTQLDEEFIYSLVQTYYLYHMSFMFREKEESLLKAQQLLIFSTPIAAILHILHPTRILGQIEPLSSFWAFSQFGVLFAGALAISYIFYACFYQSKEKETALKIDYLNKI